jgi:hypothetical protein
MSCADVGALRMLAKAEANAQYRSDVRIVNGRGYEE